MPSPERDRDLFYSKSVDHDTLAIGVPEWRRHLSNFAEMPQPLELHGRRYRTVEHAYQAHKFIHVNDAAVADTFTIDSPANVGRTGADAKRAANSRSLSLGASWDAAKDEVMRQALSARALVDDKFVQVLLAAREQERPLQHYEPQRDPYWGGTKDAAGRFRGRNRLGELLMQLAEQLSHGGSGTEESTFELRQRLSARDPTASALVVGISGCSRSGKSELARELAATGDAVLAFDQDDYSSKDLARHATPPGAGSILAGVAAGLKKGPPPCLRTAPHRPPWTA